jgi:Tfp pilus assembly protein PilF
MNRRKNLRAAASRPRENEVRLRNLAVSAALFVVTLFVYGQVWDFGLIVVDDPLFVENPHVRQGITLSTVAWSVTAINDANWIPLTWLSLMLDADLYGGRAGGYHATNVILHAANSVLLFMALFFATRERAKSAVVAALFALHPLHVESVAWIAERKDVLSTLFGFSSLIAYVRYATIGGSWRRWVSVLFFVGSLLSKSTLVTLPFVLLLLDYWPLRRINFGTSSGAGFEAAATRGGGHRPDAAARVDWRLTGKVSVALRLVVEKFPFLAASALFSVITVVAQSRTSSVMPLEGYSLAARCANAIVAYVAYLGKAFFPQNLAFFYPHPHESLGWTVVGFAAVLLLAMTAAAVIGIRRFPFLFVGWFWYVGTLVPMIGLVQVGVQRMADRYTYFPLIGLFLAVTWLVPELLPGGLIRTKVLPATVFASLALLSATTFSQIEYWHDSVTLLRHSMECTPDNSVAHEYLASAYVSAGEVNKAAQELEQAIRLEPESARLHLQLGGALQELGRLDEAAAHYRQALAVDPRSADAYTNLGLIFVKRHQYADAKRQYLQALEIDPDFAPAHLNLAALCLTTEDFAGTVEHCERVLRVEPDLAPAEMCLAMAFRAKGRLDDAVRHFKRVLQLTPDDSKAREELARTLAMQRSGGLGER